MDLAGWLEQQGLVRLAPLLLQAQIDLDIMSDLDDADLEKIGLSLGDRRRLLKAIGSSPIADAGESKRESTRLRDSPANFTPERRQLTVMFVDLVGSTALASRLDPEDLQQLVGRYHEAVGAAVAPYEGHIAQFLGDGVLVYFGYPRAHEDDATRAVRAALNIVKTLQARAAQGRIEVQTRIGIATGLVVVGEIGAGTAAAERSASGETPNLAARLQAHAQPGEVVLAEDTRRLVGESFELESLGRLDLKGFAAPVQAWRVLGERAGATRFEAQHMQGLVEFIGRESEVALLLERWTLARDGEGQAVVLSGEAGIGKSRICQSLRERLAGEPVATVLLQCSPYFASSALYPVTQHLERTAAMLPADSRQERAAKLEQLGAGLAQESLECLLRLMGLADPGPTRADGVSPLEEKAHTLEALEELLRRLAQRQPVLLLVEDAHWIDPTTEELLGRLALRLRELSVLLLVTCRPEYVPPWGSAAPLTRLNLNRLPQRQCEALVNAVAGKALPPQVLSEILRKTDGIPLFVEELTKTVVQSGLLHDTPEGYRLDGPLPALAIPSTLQNSLMARLDRLAPAKEVAQVGAVIGREFGHRLLSTVLADVPEKKIDAALADLVAAELIFRRGTPPQARYSFKHALVRDTAYSSMLKSQRALRHRQVAQALVDGQDDTPPQPELLAWHQQESGDAVAAMRGWQVAGDQALARSAVREAITHYESALTLLERVRTAEPSCDEFELGVRTHLGSALFETEGFASARARQNYTKSLDLATSLNRPDDQIRVCSAIAATLGAAGRIDDAVALLEQFEPPDMARVNPSIASSRLRNLGQLKMLRGDLNDAGSLLAEAVRSLRASAEVRSTLITTQLVLGLYQLNHNLMLRGLLDSAEAVAREGLETAERRQHANSCVLAMSSVAQRCLLKGNLSEAVERSTEALELAQRYGVMLFFGQGKLAHGMALVAQAQLDDGIRLCREGCSAWERFGGKFYGVQFAADAAQALLDAGCRNGATDFIVAGEKTQSDTDEKWYAAQLGWLRGRLAQLDGDVSAAEARYRGALEIAERQGALLFALRAATWLARLCHAQNRSAEADAVLRPIYERFTEGFDWPDLVRARAVLERRE